MKLMIIDFDGNAANTFTASPNGIGVKEAYEIAIHNIFGDTGERLYRKIGSLQNRAPSELVADLFSAAKDSQELINHGKVFHENQNGNLSRFVPEGKGAGLTWNDSQPETTLAEMLVLRKLELLTAEIGPEWPKPFEGVLSFLKQCEEKGIKVIILSSGHELFIKKVFQLWGVKAPEMITDDDLRGKTPYLSKPNPALIEFVLKKAPKCTPIYYLGDDPIKDGQLAINAGIPFGWFNPSREKSSVALPENTIEFQNWKELPGLLYW